jgi:hypothetical protein
MAASRRYEHGELEHWLAADPERLAEALEQHQPSGGSCAACHRQWPCGMHRHARAALLMPFTLAQMARQARERPVTSGRCRCGSEVSPPRWVRYWYPDQPPGPSVYGVVRYGEWPRRRRFERRHHPARDYWLERGTDARCPETPLSWADVGRCPAEVSHPATAVWQDDDGHWLLDLAPRWPAAPGAPGVSPLR